MITDNNVLVSRVKDKIKKLIESRNVTVYELAQKSDLTEACIRNWFTKRNYTPSLEALEKISKAFQIEPFELLCEDEDVLAATPENKAFVTAFGKLTLKQKEALLSLLESFND